MPTGRQLLRSNAQPPTEASNWIAVRTNSPHCGTQKKAAPHTADSWIRFRATPLRTRYLRFGSATSNRSCGSDWPVLNLFGDLFGDALPTNGRCLRTPTPIKSNIRLELPAHRRRYSASTTRRRSRASHELCHSGPHAPAPGPLEGVYREQRHQHRVHCERLHLERLLLEPRRLPACDAR
jgi:hypothetical protein